MSERMEVMKARHSVRQFLKKRIPDEVRAELDAYAAKLNAEGSLHIQILYEEPECFSSRRAHYGKFQNCENYISMVGVKAKDLEERCGYYGELLVLKAQELGLNTCWTALTHGPGKAKIASNETEVIVIALGYGASGGQPHKGKTAAEVSDCTDNDPLWYRNGIEAALLAPTAVNQQKFRFRRNGNEVSVTSGLLGPCLKIDLGIVKCHFELGAGRKNFTWAQSH